MSIDTVCYILKITSEHMIISISDASKQLKVSRAKLYRMKDSGQISFVQKNNGTTGIDTSELIRVFGENKNGQNSETPDNTLDTNKYDVVTENFYLKKENEMLMRNLQRTEAQVDQLMVSIQEQNKQILLTQSRPKKSFWQRLWQK